jgi:predicted dehydrogenase
MSRVAGAGVAATLMTVPRSVLGGAGAVAPSGKITMAFVGVGAQGLRVMLSFLRQPDVQAVAVCDVNAASGDYHQWSESEFCNSVPQLLGASAGWEWLSPNQPLRLTHSLQVTAGVAGREPCRKIVDAYNARGSGAGQARGGCSAYRDFRELLEKEKDLDAVVVGTPDHWHAPISIAAMKKGKHVFCQKPMTHSVHEARRMGEVARETGVSTQLAVGNQASEETRLLTEWVADGAIGPVRQVLNWSSRPFWAQAVDRPAEAQPVPEGLDWDMWLGPTPERPFNHAYLPFVWRGWHDFGCGALGDMGCYSFDTIFRVLKLEAPSSVEAASTERYPETFPQASIIRFEFPARGDMPPVTVTWYDGGLTPWRPEELEPEGRLAEEGLMFIGERGKILCGFTGENPKLIPEAAMKAYRQPPKSLPRSIGHEREWLEACKGGAGKPGAQFEFSALVTETILLGNVALRTGEKLAWDRAGMKAANAPAAGEYIRPKYRGSWMM